MNVIEVEKIYNRDGGISGYSAKASYVLKKTPEEVLNLAITMEANKMRCGGVSTRVVFVCRPLKYAKSVELGTRPNSFSSGMFIYSKSIILEAISRGKVMNDFTYLRGRLSWGNED